MIEWLNAVDLGTKIFAGIIVVIVVGIVLSRNTKRGES